MGWDGMGWGSDYAFQATIVLWAKPAMSPSAPPRPAPPPILRPQITPLFSYMTVQPLAAEASRAPMPPPPPAASAPPPVARFIVESTCPAMNFFSAA